MTILRILILGRPNVGKSSLFNRLAGKKAAIVHNRRGVTRDLKTETVQRHGLCFALTDSAGLEEALAKDLITSHDVIHRQLLEKAIAGVNLVLLMIDGQKGITTGDEEIAAWLRPFDQRVLVLVNKSEGKLAEPYTEAYRLGFTNILPISATHNQGINDLLSMIASIEPQIVSSTDADHSNDVTACNMLNPSTRKLAILGRPNVGKSTITNALLPQARVVTGDMAGLTRDANEMAWPAASDDQQQWSLIDTAGLRAHGQYRDSLDRVTAEATWNAIRRADVVALVIEANSPLTRGDLSIAKDCAHLGRPMIVVVNKTDLVDNIQAIAKELSHQLIYDLAQLRHVPFVCISAVRQQGLENIAPLARQQADRAARRVGTGALNRWLEHMLSAHPPPLIKGRRLRIKYMTQAEVSPPSFVFFSSQKASVPESYVRYLRNGLIDDFDFDGIPLRLSIRSSRNPYNAQSSETGGKTAPARVKHTAHTKRLPKSQQRQNNAPSQARKRLSLKGRAQATLRHGKSPGEKPKGKKSDPTHKT